jgi:chemotaxis protein CheD
MKPLLPRRQRLLLAGDFYFGRNDDLYLHTVLGSCVAITAWHKASRMGCMSHCLLPDMPSKGDNRETLYVAGAVERLLRHLRDAGVVPEECEIKLFGGGNMFPRQTRKHIDVGMRNVHSARAALQAAGFRISKEHVGGIGHRVVILDLASGDIWLRAHRSGTAEIELVEDWL